MKVIVLSSGSKGNTTYIETKETRILIDNMIALLEELEQDYPKNIKINREV